METTEPIQRILVATDFSPTATAAFDWAVDLARAHGSELVIVHAIETTATETLPVELQTAVTRSLDVLEQSATRSGVTTKAYWEAGRAWEVIPAMQREHRCDLIVVGARGHTSYIPHVLGSRADRIVRTASVPVITIHGADAEKHKASPLRTALVATDFSEEAALATSTAARLLDHGAGPHKLVLLHVTQSAVPYEYFRAGGIGPLPTDPPQEHAESVLESLAAPLRSKSIEVTTIVRSGYPATIIEDEAQATEADLIAVGTHGRGGLSRLLLGSIAERVLHHAPCPVLTVRHPSPQDPVHLAAEETAAV